MKKQVISLLHQGTLIIILLTSILNQVKAQENKKETVRIKVICSENGNHTAFDTTFTNNDMDINSIISNLNIPPCGEEIGDINIDSIVNVALSAINIDSIATNINDESDKNNVLIFNDNEKVLNDTKCKMIRIKMDGDLQSDSTFSFEFNDLDSLIDKEAIKFIVKDFDNGTTGNKVIKKKVVICKIVLLDTDKKDKQIISKTVKNIDNNTLKVEKMSFYPNPTSGKFKLNFSLESQKDVNIKVLDVAGKEVYNEIIKDFSGNYSNEIDISGNKKGIYFIIINQADKVYSKKIVME